MKAEGWKQVPGFEQYQAHRSGTVKRNGRLLKPRKVGAGYYQLLLSKNGKIFPRYVHRIIHETFRGAISAGHHIDHIDRNTQNNTLTNLQQLTPWQNVIRSKRGAWWRSQTTIPEFDNVTRK